MLRPDVQKKLAEAVWYSPASKSVKLDPKYDAKLYNTPEKVAQLIQIDWKWYNERQGRGGRARGANLERVTILVRLAGEGDRAGGGEGKALCNALVVKERLVA